MDSSFYTAKGSFTGMGWWGAGVWGCGGVGSFQEGKLKPIMSSETLSWITCVLVAVTSTWSQCLIGYLPKPPTPLLGFLVAPQLRLALLQRLGTHCPSHTRPVGGSMVRVAQCLPWCSQSHAEAIRALSASTNRNWFHKFPSSKYDPIQQ